MAIRHQKSVDPRGRKAPNEADEKQAGSVNDDACRCKKTAHMNPRELLRLMISDLAFWRKEKAK
jgi:hypothetical protein